MNQHLSFERFDAIKSAQAQQYQVAMAAQQKKDLYEMARATLYYGQCLKGQHSLREALETTSDYERYFNRVLNRFLVAQYDSYPVEWEKFAVKTLVKDFTTVERYAIDDGSGLLSLAPEGTRIERRNHSVSKYSYKLQTYAGEYSISMEAIANDDLRAFERLPSELAKRARETEYQFITSLFVDANGPRSTVFTSGNKNIVTGNPALDNNGLRTAIKILSSQVDNQGMPIMVEGMTLVIPPQLRVQAEELKNQTQYVLDPNEVAGTASTQTWVPNWYSNNLNIVLNPAITYTASAANGLTSWFLFADPKKGRPAIEVGFLAGADQPMLYRRKADAESLSGQNLPFSFDTRSYDLAIMMHIGGTVIDPKMVVGSNGSGS